MKATQLIEQLQALVAEHGDLPVVKYDETAFQDYREVDHAYFFVVGDEHEDDDPDFWRDSICLD